MTAQMPMMMRRSAHQDVADEEDDDDEVVEEAREEEGDGVGAGLRSVADGVSGGMTSARVLPIELRDGNDGVAVGAQGVDEYGQSGDGGRAVAAAVVHEDDGAAESTAWSSCQSIWCEDAVDDLLRSFARMSRPSRRCRSCCR